MSLYEFKVKAIGDGIIYLDSELSTKYWHLEGQMSSTVNLSFTSIEGGAAYSVLQGTATDLDIVIPPTYDGKPVKEIANRAFYVQTSITSVFIPSSVEIIAYQAFTSYYGLTGDLIIPDSVTTIGGSAFNGCSGLTGDLIIPNSVINIGNRAFYNCYGFKGNFVIGNSVETIKDEAFYGGYYLTGDLIIPDSVTSNAISYYDARQAGAIIERVIPDRDNAVRYDDTRKVDAIIERGIPDRGNK
jgi:hypothetical protein